MEQATSAVAVCNLRSPHSEQSSKDANRVDDPVTIANGIEPAEQGLASKPTLNVLQCFGSMEDPDPTICLDAATLDGLFLPSLDANFCSLSIFYLLSSCSPVHLLLDTRSC